jgi:hypothetical protein
MVSEMQKWRACGCITSGVVAHEENEAMVGRRKAKEKEKERERERERPHLVHAMRGKDHFNPSVCILPTVRVSKTCQQHVPATQRGRIRVTVRARVIDTRPAHEQNDHKTYRKQSRALVATFQLHEREEEKREQEGRYEETGGQPWRG